MPYRRTYRPRRTLRRRPRRMMRRRTLRRPLMRRAMKVHHFRRTFKASNIASTTTGVLGGYSFSLDQLPNYTEFTNLFDQYRINKIVVKFIPNHNSSDVSVGTQVISNFNTVIDPTDATAPTSGAELYEYQNWRLTRGISAHTRVFTPASLDVVATATTASANPTWKQWLATSSPDVKHYGLKYYAEPSNANGDTYWFPYITMYFSCKSTK